MKRATLTKIAALMIILSVSACADFRRMVRGEDRADLETWNLVVEGESASEALKGRTFEELLADDDSKVGEALRVLSGELKDSGIDLTTDEGRAKLEEQLEQLSAGTAKASETAKPLLGIEGVSTAAFLRDALEPEIEVVTRGKIRDYVYVEEKESGHLAVDMTTEVYRSGKLILNVFLHWDIELLEGHFKKYIRQGSPSNPDNPFPQIPNFDLPEEATNPANRRSIWARDLNLKLHAIGEKAIQIRNVFLQVNDGPIRRLSPDIAFYEVTEKSCVDLFVTGFPPGLDPQSTTPPKSATELFATDADYCLGRCTQPFIVNTGGI